MHLLIIYLEYAVALCVIKIQTRVATVLSSEILPRWSSERC